MIWVLVALIGALAAAVVLLFRRSSRQDAEIARLSALETKRADQVAMLSHEIRTPLAVILGAAQILEEGAGGDLTSRQRTFVERIIDNAYRMNTLAEQLLMRARIEAGLFTPDLAPLDIRLLLRRSAEELAPILDTTLIVDAAGAPIMVYADATLIRQVVTNLVTNAVRAGAGASTVEIRLVNGHGEAIVSVSDGGEGMTAAQRDRLFTRFASSRALGDGSGIGLYLTQQLVTLHGGRLHVDTITGKGTTMIFTLPSMDSRGQVAR